VDEFDGMAFFDAFSSNSFAEQPLSFLLRYAKELFFYMWPTAILRMNFSLSHFTTTFSPPL
jgi:hypothetical protein